MVIPHMESIVHYVPQHEQKQTTEEIEELAMFRNLYPSEPELVRLCRAKIWATVAERSQSHPSEAIPTDLAMRGEEYTPLSIATRCRAPLQVIDQLLRANIAQVGVTHSATGSVLHDALKFRASDEALELLVKAVIHYDTTIKARKCECILGVFDELGRTPLHYMVDRILRALDRGERSRQSWNILRLMVEAYPDAISVIDADGTTPLVLLLLIPKFSSSGGQGNDLEDEVYSMVQLMLSLDPKAVQVSRRLPRPWHYHFAYDNQEPFGQGDGVPSPLSCALLHGRTIKTIQILLEANRKIGVQSCRLVVTHYHEVPLHIVVSMRCAPNLLEKLVQEDSMALGISDIYGLKPLDWIWIRHTLDWCSASDPFAPITVSRRRYIHNHFLNWYRKVSNQYLGVDRLMDESPNTEVRETSKRLKSDLLWRMSIVLPEMASLKWNECKTVMETDNDHEFAPTSFSLLHAAAFVPCPLAVVKLACDTYFGDLRSRDDRMGRLPLHYAAARGGYTARYPMGASCNLHNVEEVSPLQTVMARFPEASRVTDARGQLALHIAIDYVKAEKARANNKDNVDSLKEEDDVQGSSCSSTTSSSSAAALKLTKQPGHQEIGALLHFYPESLYRRDGITMLYPFQQAAEGSNGDLELAFMLLRHDPSLVQSINCGPRGRDG
jgi:ankyrin repeat protein